MHITTLVFSHLRGLNVLEPSESGEKAHGQTVVRPPPILGSPLISGLQLYAIKAVATFIVLKGMTEATFQDSLVAIIQQSPYRDVPTDCTVHCPGGTIISAHYSNLERAELIRQAPRSLDAIVDLSGATEFDFEAGFPACLQMLYNLPVADVAPENLWSAAVCADYLGMAFGALKAEMFAETWKYDHVWSALTSPQARTVLVSPHLDGVEEKIATILFANIPNHMSPYLKYVTPGIAAGLARIMQTKYVRFAKAADFLHLWLVQVQQANTYPEDHANFATIQDALYRQLKEERRSANHMDTLESDMSFTCYR